LLLQHGADPNAVAGRSGRTPLACTAKEGRADVINVLLSRGAKIDAVDHRGRTALMKACVRVNASAVVTALVSARADVDVVDRIGWTALMHAASNNCLGPARELVKAGADVHARDFMGRTAV
ncbi:ankyrin, partial [Gonapodya prolifera JEL478]